MIVLLAAVINGNDLQASDLDPAYKFSITKAPESPYKNTWSAFQTDLYSGSFGYQYKIALPPGTNGLTPEISLSYNSHSAKGKAGWVGSGWDIPLSYIQRDIEYTRADTSDDTFDLYLNGAKHDLVYVASEDRYHTKIESFLHIKKNPDNHWVVTDKSGTQYRFGYQEDSRHAIHTSNAAASGSYEWQWRLDRIMDTNGNCIYFTYEEFTENGEAYLKAIEYNTERKRRIEFVTEARPDAYWVVEQGSEILQTRRLKEVRISVNDMPAGKYVLDYELNPAQTKSLLTTITQYGADGSSALPPIRFTYNPLVKDFEDHINWPVPGPNKYVTKMEEDGDQYYGTFDITGDGLPDYVKFEQDGAADKGPCWAVWKNTGAGFASASSDWTLSPSRSAIRYIRDVREEEGAATNTRSAFMDFNRDGYVDLLRAGGESDRKLLWAKTTGTNFAATQTITMPMTAWIRNTVRVEKDDDTPLNAPNVEQVFLDLNGDSLPDIVKRVKKDSDGFNAWGIYWNTGAGFNPVMDVWRVSHTQAWLEDFERDDMDVEVIPYDMNGDGLVDILRSMGKDEWRVYMNTGSHFVQLGANWAPPGLNDDDLIDHIEHTNPDKANDTRRDLIDMNGDGLPDMVKAQDDNGGLWDVYLNTGNGFTHRMDWETHIKSDYVNDTTRDDEGKEMVRRTMVDMNGDGAPDIAYLSDHDLSHWHVYMNPNGPADLLVNINDMLGGKIAVAYTSSRNYPNTRLPFNFWVVDTLITDNGMTGPHQNISTQKFDYAKGLYDFPTREFRGFGEVTETLGDGSKVFHFYHQDEARKGKEYNTEFKDHASLPYARNERSWNGTSTNGYYTAFLDQEKQYTYDGTLTDPKIVQADFPDYDTYGNVTKEIRYGDISAPEDDTYVTREFNYNIDRWMVDQLAHQAIRDSEEGALLQESWFAYDGDGNLVREEAYLDTRTNPITTHGYDTFGNRIQTTDPEGRVTQIAYDSLYHTFPEKTFNPKNQLFTRKYNPVNGQIEQETDPNGFVVRTVFDTFSRKIKTIQPYDTETLPTTETTYLIDGTAPEQVVLRQREISGQTDTMETHQIIDGFGNLIQTQKESENPGQAIFKNVYYDSMGRIKRQSNPYISQESSSYVAPDTAVPAIQYVYDAMGRPIQITNPDGTRIFRIFDHWNVTQTDENNHTTAYQFNFQQRLLKVVEHNNGEVYTTRYAYQPLGHLIKITDHLGNITDIAYDTLGRKLSMTDPDMGVWQYDYDQAGNLIRQTDARGIVTRIEYDPLNRKTKIDYPNDPDIDFIYDLETIGTLSQIIEPWGTTKYAYDQRTRKTKEIKTMDGNSWSTDWRYDAMDRMIEQTFPDGETIAFAYNSQGLLGSMPGIISHLSYDAFDRQTIKTYANGIRTQYTYNTANHRLARMQAAGIQDFRYTYDNVGNMLTLVDKTVGLTQTFVYDDLDRLVSASDAEYQATYTYNAIGNMIQETKNADQIHYSYGADGAGPHAVTGISGQLPGVGSLVLNNGDVFTNTNKVMLSNVSFGNPTHFMVSEDVNFTGAAWQPYSETSQIRLSPGFGQKTIYFKVKNTMGESSMKSDAIDLRLNPEDRLMDDDHDGLTNKEEYEQGTDASLADTDNDGLDDYSEIKLFRSDPNDPDTDNDGLTDSADPSPISRYHSSVSENYSLKKHSFNEGGNIRISSSFVLKDELGNTINGGKLITSVNTLQNLDSDGDGMPDIWEIENGLNPLVWDSADDPDGDGSINIKEYDAKTLPNNANSTPSPMKLSIIDNLDPESFFTCQWNFVGKNGSYGAGAFLTNQAGCSFTFTTTATGCKKISLWWTEDLTRHDHIPVEIYDGTTLLETVYVNQQTHGGQWNELGTYHFNQTAVVVIISDGNTHTVSADAVRFASEPACSISYQLSPGWNLLSVSLEPDIPFTAFSWALEVNNQAGSITKIQNWDGSGWATYAVGAPFGDFEIETGKGYFLFAQTQSTWTNKGTPPACPMNYSLGIGWNLMGFPGDGSYTSASLLEMINNNGSSVPKLQAWDGSGWKTYSADAPFGNFDLSHQQGYFLFSDDQMDFDMGCRE